MGGGGFGGCGTIAAERAGDWAALMSIARPMAERLAGDYLQGASKVGLDAEDIEQIMVAAVWDQRGDIDMVDRGVGTYIAKIMRHAALNAIRDGRALKRGGGWKRCSLDGCGCCLTDESRDERADEVLAETVAAAFGGMSEQERAYCGMAMDGLPQAAIRRAMGIGREACKRIKSSVALQLERVGIDGVEWN